MAKPTTILPEGRQRYFNNDGTPCAGGKLWTYAAGTTNPKPTYSDSDGTVENPNPLTLDAKGEAVIFWDGAYKVDLKQADGQQVTGYPVDRIKTDPASLWGLVATLLTAIGAAMIGFIQAGVGAVLRTIQDKLRESVSIYDFMTADEIADAKAYTYARDLTAAFAKAIAYLVGRGGGRLLVPSGGYRVDGTAGLDSFKNGVLLPDTNGDFSTRNGIILQGEGVSTVVRAGSSLMVVVRGARLYSSVRDLRIDGAGLAQVHGLDMTPESLDQTSELTSQSFQVAQDVHIENCVYGQIMQPGPTVAGADSGGFYQKNVRVTYNNNSVYDQWYRPDATSASNRTTRTVNSQCVFMRSKDSVYIQAGTEIDFIGCNWEMWTGTMLNYVPDSAHGANIRIIGGYGESSGAAVAITATAPECVSLIGFAHNRPPTNSEYQMTRLMPGVLNLAKLAGLVARLSFAYPGFVDLVADPDANGQKALELQLNGARKERWAVDGSKTFYGTLGNSTFSATGTGLAFSYNGNNVIDAINGASATLSFRSNVHFWTTAANVLMASMSAVEFIPRVDNATTNGGNGFRWSSVWAANGTIQTSDPRTKKDIAPTPLGLDFVRQLRPVAFRFIVGSNKVVGAREVKPAVLDEEGRELEPAVMEAIVEPIPGKRLHHGFLTTDVKEALDKFGVDFGGYVKTDPDDPDSAEALRYDQFISPLTLALQQLDATVEDLKSQVAALQKAA